MKPESGQDLPRFLLPMFGSDSSAFGRVYESAASDDPEDRNEKWRCRDLYPNWEFCGITFAHRNSQKGSSLAETRGRLLPFPETVDSERCRSRKSLIVQGGFACSPHYRAITVARDQHLEMPGREYCKGPTPINFDCADVFPIPTLLCLQFPDPCSEKYRKCKEQNQHPVFLSCCSHMSTSAVDLSVISNGPPR